MKAEEQASLVGKTLIYYPRLTKLQGHRYILGFRDHKHQLGFSTTGDSSDYQDNGKIITTTKETEFEIFFFLSGVLFPPTLGYCPPRSVKN